MREIITDKGKLVDSSNDVHGYPRVSPMRREDDLWDVTVMTHDGQPRTSSRSEIMYETNLGKLAQIMKRNNLTQTGFKYHVTAIVTTAKHCKTSIAI